MGGSGSRGELLRRRSRCLRRCFGIPVGRYRPLCRHLALGRDISCAAARTARRNGIVRRVRLVLRGPRHFADRRAHGAPVILLIQRAPVRHTASGDGAQAAHGLELWRRGAALAGGGNGGVGLREELQCCVQERPQLPQGVPVGGRGGLETGPDGGSHQAVLGKAQPALGGRLSSGNGLLGRKRRSQSAATRRSLAARARSKVWGRRPIPAIAANSMLVGAGRECAPAAAAPAPAAAGSGCLQEQPGQQRRPLAAAFALSAHHVSS